MAALKSDGTMWTWGRNADGQLGIATTTKSDTPQQVKAADHKGFLKDVLAIAPSWDHTIALKKDGSVWAWELSWNGLLGNAQTTEDSATPVQVKGVGGKGFFTDVAGIATAAGHNVAVKTDGTVFVWGSNNNDQLGLGPRGYPLMRSNPAQMPGLNLNK